MRIGDYVRWESQAGGFHKIKIGRIIEVVPAWVMPRHHTQMDSCTPRNEQSYVVCIGKSSRTYWPRTRHLVQVKIT